MNKKYILAVVIMITTVFVFYNYDQLKKREEYITTLEAKLQKLEEKNDKSSKECKELKEKLLTTKKEYKDINIYDVLIKEDNKIEQEYWYSFEDASFYLYSVFWGMG